MLLDGVEVRHLLLSFNPYQQTVYMLGAEEGTLLAQPSHRPGHSEWSTSGGASRFEEAGAAAASSHMSASWSAGGDMPVRTLDDELASRRKYCERRGGWGCDDHFGI